MLFDTTQLALERAIEGAGRRHDALAANLANANTPGYQRVDVDFHSALQSAMVGGRPAVERTSFAVAETNDGPVREDGGTVDVDKEASELARNALDYQALASIVKARSSILRSAIGGR